MEKINPFLWFNDQAEDAANFYISIFKNSKILDITKYLVDTPSNKPEDSVMTITFELDGQRFMALNGGPYFKFTEAISLFVNCETQEEVDNFWNKLSDGGEKGQCGWLKDKFGLSWQIVPSVLGKMISDKDPVKSKRVMEAMLKMTKIDINLLHKAYDGI